MLVLLRRVCLNSSPMCLDEQRQKVVALLGAEPPPGKGLHKWRLLVHELARNDFSPNVKSSDNGTVASSNLVRKKTPSGTPMYCGYGCGTYDGDRVRCVFYVHIDCVHLCVCRQSGYFW